MEKLLKELLNIVADDRLHSLKIIIEPFSVKVVLDCDTEQLLNSPKQEIPIMYEPLGKFAYIPNEEFKENFNPEEYGIDSDEIVLINKIMQCLESHGEEIEEYTSKLYYER